MARGPEGEFWKRVRSAWIGHSVRIEASDGEVEAGTPDTILSVNFRGGFIELKVWPDPCSAKQVSWHLDAIERGAYAMVLAELPDRRVWLGGAEEWNELVLHSWSRVSSTRLMDLHEALRVIACALTGGKRNGMVGRSKKGSR